MKPGPAGVAIDGHHRHRRDVHDVVSTPATLLRSTGRGACAEGAGRSKEPGPAPSSASARSPTQGAMQKARPAGAWSAGHSLRHSPPLHRSQWCSPPLARHPTLQRERADGEPASGRPKRAAAAAAAAAIAAGAPAQTRQKKGTPSPPDRKLARTTRKEDAVPQVTAEQAPLESAGEQREQGQALRPPSLLSAEQRSSEQQQQHSEQHQQQQVPPMQQLPGEQQQQRRQPALPPPVAPWVSPHRDAFAPSLEWGYQHLLPVAELRLRQAQRRRLQCQQVCGCACVCFLRSPAWSGSPCWCIN